MSEQISPSFWAGRRVFLTGHTGFKGAWLAMALRRLGAEVIGYSLPPPSSPSLFDALGLAGSLTHQIGDIRHGDLLANALRSSEAEVVFHLAAQPIVRTAYDDPVDTFSTNVMGTAHLLEAVRTTKTVSAVIVITSDKVYENVEWEWPYRETDRLGGKEPYGASKACCELVVDAYRHSYMARRDRPIPVATVRAGNIIGGGDWARDRLIPDAVRAFSENRPLKIRNPLAVRPWQHVTEPIRGYLMIAQRMLTDRDSRFGAMNFGPAEQSVQPVSVLADKLATQWGEGASWELESGRHPYEARFLTIDSSRAAQILGWSPRWSFDGALQATADWYKTYYRGGDIHATTASQLEFALFG